jgi:hypothetical protein
MTTTAACTRLLRVASLLLVTACAGPQIHLSQLAALDKGLTPEDTQARLRLPPLAVCRTAGTSKPYEFHSYHLNNGVQRDLYLLAFHQQRLVYWGYIAEFRRQPDGALNDALSSVLPRIQSGTC